MSQLHFGLPSWFTPPEPAETTATATDVNNQDNPAVVPEPKISMSGVIQLITAGLGAPFLGDFEGVDKETGKFMFSLEDLNPNQVRGLQPASTSPAA